LDGGETGLLEYLGGFRVRMGVGVGVGVGVGAGVRD